MDREFNGKKIKYDEGNIWLWREMKTKPSEWRDLKGTINKKDGYRQVMINYKLYKYHRVVYWIHNPEWDIDDNCRDNSIDHIDRDKSNNNIENLRLVTHKHNMWNRDCKGYCIDKSRGKYKSEICVNGKRKSLGYFENEDDARNAYLNAKAIHHRIPQATPL